VNPEKFVPTRAGNRLCRPTMAAQLFSVVREQRTADGHGELAEQQAN